MASIDRVEALAKQYKKKKNPRETSLTVIEDLANEIKSGNKKAGIEYMGVKPEEIAPIKTTSSKKEEKKRTWFNSGVFSDGYQFGDITKTILGTSTDIQQDLSKGVYKIGEGLIDTGAYLLGGGAKLIGQDKFADSMKSFVKRDLVEEKKLGEQFANNSKTGILNNLLNGNYEALNPFDKKNADDDSVFESNSLLGDKSDSLVQSGGQLAGTIGLQAVGVPWWVTTGVTSFGSGTQEAFSNDATYGEAGAYGLISAGAEILTEKISGGISFGGVTLDAGLKDVLFKNISNNTIKTLGKFGFDAAGEGFEEVLTEVIQNVGKKLTYEDEQTWQEILASPEALDAYLESFIGGAVLGGGSSVINSVRNNDIAPVENEAQVEGLQQELVKKQEEQKQAQDPREQQIIQEEIEVLQEELTEATNAQQITNESELKKQNFTYQAQAIDSDIKKAVYESASQVMNNTEKSHKFVDVVAKIAEEKGTTYKFTNNEQLKQMGYAKDNVTVNGLVNENGEVLINIDSAKALNTVVGHETTHLLEGTKEYEALKQIAIEYSKSKGEYDTKMAQLYSLYKDTDANIENELVSDIVGDYLFTDENFIKELSVKQPTVFEKIKNFISDLVVKFKGTEQEKQLRQLQRSFEKAYKAQSTQTTTNTKYSLADNQGRTLSKEQQEYFKDSKARDEEGNLLTVYHGTPKGGFNIFDANELGKSPRTSRYGKGFYFTDNKKFAQEYMREEDILNETYRHTPNSQLYEVYLDIKNPFIVKNNGHNLDRQGLKQILLEGNREWFFDSWIAFELKNNYDLGMLSEKEINDLSKEEKIELYLKYHFDKFGDQQILQEMVRAYSSNQDLIDSMKRNLGIDGIIYKSKLGNQYIAFNSSQIKNIDNTNPTSNPDIRYSLSEDGKMVDTSTNEEVKLETSETGTHGTLMAIHNLTESKFKGVLELGGFPLPSIAITNNVQEGFGDISVLFDKTTIDPSNKLNEVYDRDVWSPRVPRTVNKFASNIENAAANLGLKSYELRERLEGNTIEAVTERLLREDKVIDKFFTDKNIQVEQVENVYKNKEPQAIYHKFPETQNFIKEHDITYQKLMEDTNLRENYLDVLKEWAREKYKNSPLKSKLVDGLPPYIVSLEEQLNKDAKDGYYEEDLYVQSLNEDFDKIKSNEQELDEPATKMAQQKAKDLKVEEHKTEIESYIREQLETVNEGKYFEKEGVDPYTDNGRKPFSQLHTKYTLENLVKAMKKQSTIAGENMGTPGFGEIQAAMAKKFTSIGDIKASESQIVPRTQEEELTKPFRDTIWNDINEISKGYKYYNPNADSFDYNNQYGADNASQSLFDLANSKKISLENFKKILNENLIDSTKLSDELLQKTINDLIGLRDIPTEYFEAKPQRAVGFDEVQAVVIPNTTSTEFKQELQEAGLTYYEYDPNIEGDNQRVINQFDDLKFSLSAKNEDIAPRDPKQIYGEDVKLQVEEAIAPLQEKIETLTEQLNTVVNSTKQSKVENIDIAPTNQDIVEQQRREAFNTITDEDMLPIAEDTTPEVEDDTTIESKVESPFDERDIKEVGKRSVKAYQYENPEVRPYFQQEAGNMLNDLDNTVKGEKTVTQVYNPYTGLYENAEWTGTTRQTTEAIAYLRDNYKYSYAQIRKGLNDIIEDNGKENNAVAKRIEFMLDERLREGYTTSDGFPIPPNEEYINFLKEKQVTEYDRERLEALAVDENVPETEEVAEQTTTNAEPEQANALEQYEATLQDELSPTVNPEHIIEHKPIDTSFMRESTKKKLENYETLREKYNIDKQKSLGEFNVAIAKKTAEYEGLTNKNTKKANTLLQQIANLEIRKANVQDDYNRRIEGVSKRIDSMATQKFEQNEKKASQSEIREQLFKDTGIVSESLDHAKNISKALMHNTDPIRLQEMIFGKELGGKINKILFQQVKHNTAEKIRFQNKERSEIENLGIKPRSKESAAVQKYGEKQYVDEAGQTTKYGDSELKAEFPNVEDQEKIKKAARVIRGKYDTYIDMVNAEITKYGYNAIPKRQDYMRHFQELNDVFSRYGLPFNMQSAQANDLPVDINGLTADLKPGKNWFASALRRKGVKTTYDAISGIDGYIEGIGNLIYHTGDIQKLRGFEDYIREIYGQEHGFDNLDNLPEAEKAIRMNKIQDNHLGNYAAWIREYTNALAGKKAMVDRAFEDVFGRRIYSTLNEIKSQVGSNMVGLNIGSALTNPISMTQALAKTSKAATVKGYADTIKNIFIKDNFIEQNDFLTNRFGSDILSPTAWQKMRNAGQVFMTGTDWFASNAITRSKFYELKAKGLSDADAHKQAGDFAARILGDRSQGATPTLYNSKMLGLATQFQLEVNNQLYSMFYDTISDAKQEAKTKGTLPAAVGATFVLGQLAAYQHVYNNLYEGIAGRRPAFDVIAMIATALGIGGDDDEEEKKPLGDRLFEAADMLVDSLPYVSIFTGGGRIPISEALPIAELFSGKDQYGNEKSRLETLGEAIPYYLLPTGYSQIKKTTSGLGMYDDDLPISGSYTDSGNLRFTAEDDPMSILQAGIFGQWANPNAKEYIDSEFKSIDKSNIDELVELGFDSNKYRDYKKGLNEIKKMELEDGESRGTYIFDYINNQNATKEQKSTMIKYALRDEEVEDLSHLSMSADETIVYYKAKSNISQQVAEYTNNKKLLIGDTDSEEYKEAVGSLSNDKKAKIIDTIKSADLSDEQKAYLYGKYYSSDKTLEKVIDSGIHFDNYLTYQKDSLSLETSEAKAEYLYNANMTDETKTVIYETSVLSGFDNEKKYKDYKTVKAAGIDINSWLSYTKQEFKADKNNEGKSISGSRKRKIFSYVNSLSLSIPQKAIIIRTEYPSEDKYNKQIVNYVSGLDLPYDEKVSIFENLDMTVKNNRVYWD